MNQEETVQVNIVDNGEWISLFYVTRRVAEYANLLGGWQISPAEAKCLQYLMDYDAMCERKRQRIAQVEKLGGFMSWDEA